MKHDSQACSSRSRAKAARLQHRLSHYVFSCSLFYLIYCSKCIQLCTATFVDMVRPFNQDRFGSSVLVSQIPEGEGEGISPRLHVNLEDAEKTHCNEPPPHVFLPYTKVKQLKFIHEAKGIVVTFSRDSVLEAWRQGSMICWIGCGYGWCMGGYEYSTRHGNGAGEGDMYLNVEINGNEASRLSKVQLRSSWRGDTRMSSESPIPNMPLSWGNPQPLC